MDTSVLYYVKGYLGIDIANCSFDSQIIPYINMAIDVLRQLGVQGPIPAINGMEETWQDVIGQNDMFLSMCKTFVALSTRLYFDPPANSFHTTAVRDAISELSWRILVEAEKGISDAS